MYHVRWITFPRSTLSDAVLVCRVGAWSFWAPPWLCSPSLNTTSLRFGSARPCPRCQERLQVKYFLLGRSAVGACGKVAEFTAVACFLPHGCVYYPDLYMQWYPLSLTFLSCSLLLSSLYLWFFVSVLPRFHNLQLLKCQNLHEEKWRSLSNFSFSISKNMVLWVQVGITRRSKVDSRPQVQGVLSNHNHIPLHKLKEMWPGKQRVSPPGCWWIQSYHCGELSHAFKSVILHSAIFSLLILAHSITNIWLSRSISCIFPHFYHLHLTMSANRHNYKDLLYTFPCYETSRCVSFTSHICH